MGLCKNPSRIYTALVMIATRCELREEISLLFRYFHGAKKLPVLVDSFGSSGALTSVHVVHYPLLRRWLDIWDGRPAYTHLQDSVQCGNTLTVHLASIRNVTTAGRQLLLDVKRCVDLPYPECIGHYLPWQ